MRTITITHNIYKYRELSDDAKQKVKDWHLSDYDRTFFFSDNLNELLKVLFGNHNNLKVQYSLNYQQGDGLNIYGSVSVGEVIEYIKNYRIDMLTPKEMDILLKYAEYTDGIAIPYNHHYCYCMADYIDFADEWVDQLEWEFSIEENYGAAENIEKELIKKFEGIVRSIFFDLCKEYEEYGYDYFYEIDDIEMQELCEINEWEFYEDGTFYF